MGCDRKVSVGAPVAGSSTIENRYEYAAMSLNAVFSVIVLIWSWMRTVHRSVPNENAGDGSTRKPSVHCCERSGLRAPAPVAGLPPACSLYSNAVLWQYWARSSGTLDEQVSMPVTP